MVKVPIQVEYRYKGEIHYFETRERILPIYWNHKKGRPKESYPKKNLVDSKIERSLVNIIKIIERLEKKGLDLTFENINSRLQKKKLDNDFSFIILLILLGLGIILIPSLPKLTDPPKLKESRKEKPKELKKDYSEEEKCYSYENKTKTGQDDKKPSIIFSCNVL